MSQWGRRRSTETGANTLRRDNRVKMAFHPVRKDRLLNKCSGTTEYTLRGKKIKVRFIPYTFKMKQMACGSKV